MSGMDDVRRAFDEAHQPDDPELTALRRRARRVDCPWCKARAGEPCVVYGTDVALTLTAAHPSRIDAMEGAA